MRPSILAPLVPLVLVAACGREVPAPPNQQPAPPPTTSAALHLGEPISAPVVALAEVASHAADYKGRTFTTTGTVTAVCQEMGCWMEIKDASNAAHIRMHGHSFYVPRTASGHHARVQATLVPTSGGEEDCTEEAAKQMGHPAAKVELDALGVELD
jgi:hypothetical protein